MSDKPDLIQTVATISSMCEMDLSQETHNEMFEFVAQGISDLESKIDKLEKDAARYRYLRESRNFGGMQKYRLEWYLPRRFDTKDFGVELDDAIDERINKDKQG